MIKKGNLNQSWSFINTWEHIGWLVTFAFIPTGSNFPGFIILLGARLFRLLKRQRPKYRESSTPWVVSWTNRLIVVFLIIVVLSSLFSSNKLTSLAWSLGFLLLFYVFTFGAQPFGYQTPVFLTGKYLPALGISSAVVLIYSLAGYFLTLPPRTYIRTYTFFSGYNGLGTILTIMTGLMIGYLVWRGGKFRYLLIPYFGLTLPVLFLTQSRGGWFGFAAMLGIFSLFNRKVLIVFLIIILISGCIFLGSSHLKERFISSFSYEQNLSRVYIWKATLQMIKDHPLLGIGTGNFPVEYPKYRLPQAWEKDVAYAHNLFMEVTVEFGFIGLILFCLFLFGIIYMGFSLALTGNPFYQGVFAGFIGVLVHQQVDIPIWSIGIGGIFWMMVGLMIGMYRYEFSGKRDIP
jgi:O-antigen ligase